MNLISSFRLTEAFLQDNISRINSRIFIGDIDALNDESIIKENKITHVVTTVEKTEYIKFLRVTYCEPIEYKTLKKARKHQKCRCGNVVEKQNLAFSEILCWLPFRKEYPKQNKIPISTQDTH